MQGNNNPVPLLTIALHCARCVLCWDHGWDRDRERESGERGCGGGIYSVYIQTFRIGSLLFLTLNIRAKKPSDANAV